MFSAFKRWVFYTINGTKNFEIRMSNHIIKSQSLCVQAKITSKPIQFNQDIE